MDEEEWVMPVSLGSRAEEVLREHWPWRAGEGWRWGQALVNKEKKERKVKLTKGLSRVSTCAPHPSSFLASVFHGWRSWEIRGVS